WPMALARLAHLAAGRGVLGEALVLLAVPGRTDLRRGSGAAALARAALALLAGADQLLHLPDPPAADRGAVRLGAARPPLLGRRQVRDGGGVRARDDRPVVGHLPFRRAAHAERRPQGSQAA